jgi:atypical dual specificity phosphatase
MTQTPLFRQVHLPASVPGALYLHSMPGRYEAFELSAAEIERLGIARLVCLAPGEEIASKSPDYAVALAAGVPWRQESFPIPDFGRPPEPAEPAFRRLAARLAAALGAGEKILIHCGAGIGRTGMLALAVLLYLGLPAPSAITLVKEAGAGPETPEQWEVVWRLVKDLPQAQ